MTVLISANSMLATRWSQGSETCLDAPHASARTNAQLLTVTLLPWMSRSAPRFAFPDPAEALIPPADVPEAYGTEIDPG
jgi:hypothetical protein